MYIVTEYSFEDAIKVRNVLANYQDTLYLNMIKRIQENQEAISSDDFCKRFLIGCGRDIAGEIVRQCFDTSDYYITVDQMAERILHFKYDNEYDPLAECGGAECIKKSVYNTSEIKSERLDSISNDLKMAQKKLFTEDRKSDRLDSKGKREFRKEKTQNDGHVYDDLTGEVEKKYEFIRNGKTVFSSDLEADHVQSRNSATYNMNITSDGVEKLKVFWNSSDNFQMMFKVANASKSDIRVCKEEHGRICYRSRTDEKYRPENDITYKATPEQQAQAVIMAWESVDPNRKGKSEKKIQALKDRGYLNEDGKVPESVKDQLVKNIRHSQNEESFIVLENLDYDKEIEKAWKYTKQSVPQIISGQIIYYVAPPLIFEIRQILSNGDFSLDTAVDKLSSAGKRICKYVVAHLKDILVNIVGNTLKNFIKSFMDILIEAVKATVKKVLKVIKKLLISTVDAVKILFSNNSSLAEKADAVFNLYGVTITSCVVEIIFDIAQECLQIPEPFATMIFGPIQILATVVCSNLTLLILEKADLFDVHYGFKLTQIRNMFEKERNEFKIACEESNKYAENNEEEILAAIKRDTKDIYNSICRERASDKDDRDDLERINQMLNMQLDYEKDWLAYLGGF